MTWRDDYTSEEEQAQMEDDAATKARQAEEFAKIMRARAGGSSSISADDQTNIPNDQAEGRQPGSSRIAGMFKTRPGSPQPTDGATDASSNPSSSTSIISRPDFSQRDKLKTLYETKAQEDPGLFRFQRARRGQQMDELARAIQMEEAAASGDLGTQTRYAAMFDPKRMGNPMQGVDPSSGRMAYFQDVLRRDPATGRADFSYENTGVQPPLDVRRLAQVRGGVGVSLDENGQPVYENVGIHRTQGGAYVDGEFQAAPPGVTRVPGGFLDAQGQFHSTVPQTSTGRPRPAYPAGVINGYNALLQTHGKPAADAYLQEWESRLGSDVQGAPGGGAPAPLPVQPPAANAPPTTSAPRTGPRPAAPAGQRGQVTPQDPSVNKDGVKAVAYNKLTGTYLGYDANGKEVRWVGPPVASSRGMGR